MGHHNGSAYYPGRILRSLWYTQGNKKEKDKVLSHLIEIAKARQSQAKIVVTLRPNAVFFLLVLPLSLSKLFTAVQSQNLVHQH